MDGITILAIAIFVLGYLGITLEHKIDTSKSAIALIIGGLLWLLIALTSTPEVFHEEILHSGAEIF